MHDYSKRVGWRFGGLPLGAAGRRFVCWRSGEALGMSRSEDYRRFAGACLEIADATEDQRTRAVFIQMAQVWYRLAEEHAKEEDAETAG
jgi:hypothetical protein